ncbi:MAG: GNAT family N-acetyltransferase [Bacteroidia bacterium]|nr:GNAT family N-acetyltransferase [Bacteroidia bacterium]
MKLMLGTEGHLALREAHHAAEMARLVSKNRDLLAPFLPWVHSYNGEMDARLSITKHQEQAREGISLNLGIWIGEELSGMVSFVHIDPLRQKASLGYWLDQDKHGQGWMRKACKALLTHGFEAMNMKEVQAQCAQTNSPSQNLLRAIGFEKGGFVQGPDWASQQELQYIRYKLTCEKWLALKS